MDTDSSWLKSLVPSTSGDEKDKVESFYIQQNVLCQKRQ